MSNVKTILDHYTIEISTNPENTTYNTIIEQFCQNRPTISYFCQTYFLSHMMVQYKGLSLDLCCMQYTEMEIISPFSVLIKIDS